MKITQQSISPAPHQSGIIIMPALLTLFMMALYSISVFYTNDTYYGFLLWNLFLAWLPFLFAIWAHRNYLRGGKTISIMMPAFFWLLFFPNAPYIITDLIHLRSRTGIPAWYDAMMVFGYAFTGFLIGLASLYLIHRMLRHVFNSWKSWLLILVLMVMSGYGIYLGRVLRWNSWDIFLAPAPLINDVQHTIFAPASLAMTLLFSVLMGITYPFLFYFAQSDQKK